MINQHNQKTWPSLSHKAATGSMWTAKKQQIQFTTNIMLKHQSDLFALINQKKTEYRNDLCDSKSDDSYECTCVYIQISYETISILNHSELFKIFNNNNNKVSVQKGF